MDARREHSREGADSPTPTVDERALDRFMQLGDLHRAADSLGEALRNYRASLDLLSAASAGGPRRAPDPRCFDLHLRMADCYLVRGELRLAKSSIQSAAALPGPHDAAQRARLSGYSGMLAGNVGDYSAALERLARALDVLGSSEARDDIAFCARLHLHRGAAEERIGNTVPAGEAFEVALGLYKSLGDRRGMAHALNNLGLNRKQSNRLREAISFMHRALEVLDEVGDYGRKAQTCLNLGLIYTRVGDWVQARAQLTRALQIAREVDNRGRCIRAMLALACLEMRARRFAEARAHLLEAKDLAAAQDFRREHVLAQEFLGELTLLEGRPSQAMAILDAVLPEAQRVSPKGDLVTETLRRQADASMALGDHARAAEAANRAMTVALKLGDVVEAASARRVLALCHLKAGRDDAARAALDESLAVFAELGIRFEEARTHLAAARTRLETAGDSDRDVAIEKSLEAARPLFEALGVPGYIAEVLHVACEDRIRTGDIDAAEGCLRMAGRYVEASEEQSLAEHQMRLKQRLDEALDASVEVSDEFSPSRELHRLFRDGVDIETATHALVETVLKRTNSDRVALAKGPDPSALKIVAAAGGTGQELGTVLQQLEPVVRASMRRGLPTIPP